ncbi:MAG: polyhydroxyalkanoate synthesis repressor PhaR, partial [Bdellovibrionales bacterium]
KEGVEFNVYDAKTGEDITRSVLTQIIVEEESKAGQNLLPISFLRQLIGFYGDNMQWLVPKYLEHSMQSLAKNQEQIRGYFQNTFGSMFPFGTTLEEMGKQNLAMFERAMRMFSPFSAFGDGTKGEPTDEVSAPPAAARPAAPSGFAEQPLRNVMPMPDPSDASSEQDVQKKIAALQRQLADLAKGKV